MSDLRKAALAALEDLVSVLCDPAGRACIRGSDDDLKIVDNALDTLRAALAQPEAKRVERGGFAPFDRRTASREDHVAWVLCQIIDDDAPMRWTRYRFAAECIAHNAELMSNLNALAQRKVKFGDEHE